MSSNASGEWFEPDGYGECVKEMPVRMAMVGILVNGVAHLRGCLCFEREGKGTVVDLVEAGLRARLAEDDDG